MDNINEAFCAWVRHMRTKSLQTGGERYKMYVSDDATVYDRSAKLFYHPTKSLALTAADIEEFGLDSQEASVFEVIPATSDAIGRYYVMTVHGLLGSSAEAPYAYDYSFFYTTFASAKAAGDLWASNIRCKTPWFAVLRLVDKGADGSLLV